MTLRLVLQDALSRKDLKGLRSISLPGAFGRVELLPNHAAMYFALTKGTIIAQPDHLLFEIESGVADIRNNECVVFTTSLKETPRGTSRT